MDFYKLKYFISYITLPAFRKRRMTSIIETTDGWDGPCAQPTRVVEDWEKEECGCAKCYPHNYWDSKKSLLTSKCYKTIAYEAQLEANAKTRFSSYIDMAGFKPASREQIAEWTTWLSSSDAIEAEKTVAEQTDAAMRTWRDYKFDPVTMENHIGSMWPAEQKKYKLGPMWTAYDTYGKEQYELLKTYGSVKDETTYNNLMKHIRDHGNIILLKDMSKKHSEPLKEAVAKAPTLGRRAARKMRNLSEKSTSSHIGTVVNKVTTKQGYEASD